MAINHIDNETVRTCNHCGCIIDDNAPARRDVRIYNVLGDLCGECAPLYDYCESCGNYEITDDLYITADTGRRYCEHCIDGVAYECQDCGDYVTYPNWIDEIAYCDTCAPSHEPLIKRYHAHHGEELPIHRRRGEAADTTLTFGVEIECDDPTDDLDPETGARAVNEAMGGDNYVVFEHDGSLDNGFECISRPMSLGYHMYEAHWKGALRAAGKAGFKSQDTDTCGLHIHVGRKQLGDDEVVRNVVAVTAALADGGSLTRFTRRTSSELEQWAKLPTFAWNDWSDDRRRYCRRFGTNTRYTAVNRTNCATIEFRIFKGTLVRDTLIASLQLVNNICQYAQAHSFEECCQASWTDILAFHEWKELNAYSLKRGLRIPAQAQA